MCARLLIPAAVRFAFFFAFSVSIESAMAQPPADGWVVPRTEYGHPDFQGYWSNRTQTPIERPPELGDRKAYSEEEAMALEAAVREADRVKYTPIDPDRPAPEAGSRVDQQADENFIDNRVEVLRVKGEYRTSMIVDPPDGRFPFREGGRQLDIFGQWRAAGHDSSDGPEIRPAGERCLSRGIPPMTVTPYNANFQFVQTEDYVMLFGEMVHDARIIRLDSQPLAGEIPSWLGDSTGYWEGDTLVVHSRNFRPEISHFRVVSSARMELTERFEMVGENEIFYQFTVTDPVIYERPFTEELTLKRRAPGEHLYEYACHEGNYSMGGILGGARRAEVEAESGAR
jgi:hypothetical protein